MNGSHHTLRLPLLYLAWVGALLGLLGSLFFSEVVGYPPCTLCWYQRIALYPLVALLPVGILLRDERIRYYTLPLVAVGALIALYHNLLYYGFISEGFSVCTGSLSCSTRQLELFGFITIPLMSLASFIGLGLLIGLSVKNKVPDQ